MYFSEELLLLIEKSLKHQALLKKFKIAKGKKTCGVKLFARTRWTVKGHSLASNIVNYIEILETFKESLHEETRFHFLWFYVMDKPRQIILNSKNSKIQTCLIKSIDFVLQYLSVMNMYWI